MNIFEALRADHDKQRALLDKLASTSGASDEREAWFAELEAELADHAAMEEKHFYAHLMRVDMTIDKARHSVAEHKELDDRVAALKNIEHSNPQWLKEFKELKHRVLHHLEEEEQEVFQMAGKVLSDAQKSELATAYNADMQDRRD